MTRPFSLVYPSEWIKTVPKMLRNGLNSEHNHPYVPIAERPRLLLEIPRGTERFRQLHCLQSAAERTNSTLKDDNAILREPPVRSLRRAEAVSLMGVMTTLIDRVVRLVLDVTVKQRKFKATGDKHWFDRLSPPEIPAHLKPFAQTA